MVLARNLLKSESWDREPKANGGAAATSKELLGFQGSILNPIIPKTKTTSLRSESVQGVIVGPEISFGRIEAALPPFVFGSRFRIDISIQEVQILTTLGGVLRTPFATLTSPSSKLQLIANLHHENLLTPPSAWDSMRRTQNHQCEFVGPAVCLTTPLKPHANLLTVSRYHRRT
jgi:hypothetical protein